MTRANCSVNGGFATALCESVRKFYSVAQRFRFWSKRNSALSVRFVSEADVQDPTSRTSAPDSFLTFNNSRRIETGVRTIQIVFFTYEPK